MSHRGRHGAGTARRGLGARDAYRTFAPFAAPHWRSILVSLLLVLASTGAGLLKPWPLAFLFDEVLIPEGEPRSVQTLLLGVAGAIAAIALLDAVLAYLRTFVLMATGQKVAFAIRTALYRQIQRLSLTFHERQHTGELITRLTKDVDKVQELVTSNIITAGSSALTLVGMLAVMLLLDWPLAVAVLGLLPLIFAANLRFRARIKHNEMQVRHTEGDITSLAEETLSSIRVVKAFGREGYESSRFQAHNEQALEATIRVGRTEAAFASAMNVLTALALAGMVWLGAQRVLSGSLTPGELLIFVAYLRDFYGPVRDLSKLSAQISKTSIRAEKIADVLAEEADVRDLPGATPAPRLRGEIEFDHVCFAYHPGHPVLHDVCFTVRPGELLALVGATGAGKSTIAALVPRLYDPSAGRVCIDGRDVRGYTLATLQAQVGFVLQTSLLFSATVRENIAYGRPDASFEDIVRAAEIANAHEFILSLPRGYDTVVGERGDTMSGGERQRIAIARAVVRDAPILLLDETTTGLDARSEAAVLVALQRLMVGRTTIAIAHKLSTVRRADRILVVDGGRIVERGTHGELLGRDGHYAQLCRLQGIIQPDPGAADRAPTIGRATP